MLDIHPRHLPVLLKNDIFNGIYVRQVPHALSYLNAYMEEYDKGEMIVRLGDKVRAGIILQGRARVSYYDESFNPMAVDHLLEGFTFGQAATCAVGYTAQIELVAVAYTKVVRLDFDPILNPCCDASLPEHHHVLASNIIRSVSQHAVLLHNRLRIVGQKTVRDRLKLYLEHLTDGHHEWVHIPFSMSDLAMHLNSDRSALYKEIRLLKEEGILEWNKRRVRVHRHDFGQGSQDALK